MVNSWKSAFKISLWIFLSIVGMFAAWFFFFRPEVHRHCIKAAYFSVIGPEGDEEYFPRHERGWGDAMLAFSGGLDDPSWVRPFTGVGDDGAYLIAALKSGEDVDEDQCTRIYVQGLRKDAPGGIAILFDRNSVKGGDHRHGIPGQKMLREAITVDGGFLTITDEKWPEFVEQQRVLLKEEGFSEEEVAQFYGPAD